MFRCRGLTLLWWSDALQRQLTVFWLIVCLCVCVPACLSVGLPACVPAEWAGVVRLCPGCYIRRVCCLRSAFWHSHISTICDQSLPKTKLPSIRLSSLFFLPLSCSLSLSLSALASSSVECCVLMWTFSSSFRSSAWAFSACWLWLCAWWDLEESW